MKTIGIVRILMILALFPAGLVAQDITGIWKGELYIDSTKQYIPYEISISEEKGKLSGFSHISFQMDGVEQMGVMNLKVKQDGQEVIIEDDEFIANTFSKSPPKAIKKRMELTLITHDSFMVLKGDWSTNRTKRFLSATGKIELQRKIDFKATALYKKLDELKLADNLVFSETIAALAVAANNPQKAGIKAIVDDYLGEPDLIMPIPQPGKVEINRTEKAAMQPSLVKTGKKPAVPATTKAVIPEKPKEPVVTAAVKKPEPVVKQASAAPVPEKKAVPAAASKPAVAATAQPKAAPVVAAKPVAEKPKETVAAPAVKKQETVLVPASIAKQAATDVTDRKTNTIQSVFYHSDSLTITLYDNGYIDGDTVSVLMNGKVIIAKQRLTTSYNSKSIYIDKDTPDSLMIVMYAENLGSIPPNTGLLVVHDGESVYEVRFSADLQTNAAIIFRRKND